MERGENFRRFVPPIVKDDHVAFSNEVFRVVNGSQLYGTSTAVSDEDQMGVFIEPLEYVVGFKRMDDFTWRAKPDGIRSGPGDIELTLYSMRKFMNLLIAGNPSILCTIFAPDNLVLLDQLDLRELDHHVVSKKAHPRFLGYLISQHERALGLKKGHKARRDELINIHGYDTKYAMHAIRLGLQGIELMQTGVISSPSIYSDFLISIRSGSITEAEFLDFTEALINDLKYSIITSDLPDEPDYKYLTMLMEHWHKMHWDHGWEFVKWNGGFGD